MTSSCLPKQTDGPINARRCPDWRPHNICPASCQDILTLEPRGRKHRFFYFLPFPNLRVFDKFMEATTRPTQWHKEEECYGKPHLAMSSLPLQTQRLLLSKDRKRQKAEDSSRVRDSCSTGHSGPQDSFPPSFHELREGTGIVLAVCVC